MVVGYFGRVRVGNGGDGGTAAIEQLILYAGYL